MGADAWRDNVFVERMWRSVRYERVYLKAYDSLERGAGRHRQSTSLWYNTARPHSSLDRPHARADLPDTPLPKLAQAA